MLADEIKKRMFAAMKAKDTVTKEVLRVALGEVQTAASRTGEDLDDAAVEKILRKLVKSNEESLAATAKEADRETLAREIEVLSDLLPKTLTVDEIVAALAEQRDAIRAADNDGKATGVAMKHLESSGAVVDGKDVNAAVRAIRAE